MFCFVNFINYKKTNIIALCFVVTKSIGIDRLHALSAKYTEPKTWPIKVFTILKLCKDHADKVWFKRLENLLILKFTFKMDPTKIHTLTQTKNHKNHKSAYEYAAAVDIKISEQLENGAMFCDDNHKYVPKPKVKTQFKMIPQSDKIRMVKNYSFPYDGVSINSIIPDEEVKVQLPTFADLCTFAYGENNNIVALGKVDFKAAFEQIFLNPKERQYAVYEWRGHTYLENAMPPGTRASVQAMQDFGTAVRYVVDKCLPKPLRGNSIGYVDDNIFRGRSRLQCVFFVLHFIIVCTNLNIRINPKKTIFGDAIMVALGNELNMLPYNKTAKITDERAKSYMIELIYIYHSQLKPRHELDSILGKLFSTSPIMWPLKAFTRPFIEMLPKNTHTKEYNKNEKLVVSQSVRNMIELWVAYFQRMNKTFIVDVVKPPSIQESMKSDGSDWGGGACSGTQYTLWKWHKDEVNPFGVKNTPELELKAIEGGLYAMRDRFRGKIVLLEVDSQTARDALIKKDSKNRAMWKVIKRIALFAIENNTRWWVRWIPRALNNDSDALSKNDLPRFYKIMDDAGRPYDPAITLFQRHPDNFIVEKADYVDPIPYGDSLGKKWKP